MDEIGGERPGWVALTDAGDDLLVGRAADGDVAAFEVIVRRYAPGLRVYVTRVLRSTSHVDDVVQDTFVTAWQRMDEIDDGAALRGWLARIAYRNALDRLRADQRGAALADRAPGPAELPDPQQAAEAGERTAALTAALDALPEQQRAAWLLREAGGSSYAEIADELGVPASTVRGLIARARTALVQQMAAWR